MDLFSEACLLVLMLVQGSFGIILLLMYSIQSVSALVMPQRDLLTLPCLALVAVAFTLYTLATVRPGRVIHWDAWSVACEAMVRSDGPFQAFEHTHQGHSMGQGG